MNSKRERDLAESCSLRATTRRSNNIISPFKEVKKEKDNFNQNQEKVIKNPVVGSPRKVLKAKNMNCQEQQGNKELSSKRSYRHAKMVSKASEEKSDKKF